MGQALAVTTEGADPIRTTAEIEVLGVAGAAERQPVPSVFATSNSAFASEIEKLTHEDKSLLPRTAESVAAMMKPGSEQIFVMATDGTVENKVIGTLAARRLSTNSLIVDANIATRAGVGLSNVIPVLKELNETAIHEREVAYVAPEYRGSRPREATLLQDGQPRTVPVGGIYTAMSSLVAAHCEQPGKPHAYAAAMFKESLNRLAYYARLASEPGKGALVIDKTAPNSSETKFETNFSGDVLEVEFPVDGNDAFKDIRFKVLYNDVLGEETAGFAELTQRARGLQDIFLTCQATSSIEASTDTTYDGWVRDQALATAVSIITAIPLHGQKRTQILSESVMAMSVKAITGNLPSADKCTYAYALSESQVLRGLTDFLLTKFEEKLESYSQRANGNLHKRQQLFLQAKLYFSNVLEEMGTLLNYRDEP